MSSVTTIMGDKGGPEVSVTSPVVAMPTYTTSDPAPVLGAPVVEITNSTAKITWSTNEPTIGLVYHDDEPLVFGPSVGPRLFPYVSGNLFVMDEDGLQTEHTVTLENLEANTAYYYTVGAMDSIANTTIGGSSSFRTEE